MKRGGGGYKPWFNKQNNFHAKRQKPVVLSCNNNDSDDEQSATTSGQGPQTNQTYAIPTGTKECVGWTLYFPREEFQKDSKIVDRVKVAEKHFTTYLHWYDTNGITETQTLQLKLQNVIEDEDFINNWQSFVVDLTTEPTMTLATIGLAIYNVLFARMQASALLTHRKIFVRPIGFGPQTKISKIHSCSGNLVSVTGTVVRVEQISVVHKTMTYRCSACSSFLSVDQKGNQRELITPASCQKGCKARGNFIEHFSSPHTIIQPKQMIYMQESFYVENQSNKTLEIELVQNLVNTVIPGGIVTVTGCIKFAKPKSAGFSKERKTEGNQLTLYLKAFSVDVVNQFVTTRKMQLSDNDLEAIRMIRAEASPFRLLVHSLCPSIYGHEMVKAGLILGLLSGQGLMPRERRSESHILMVGNPGTGKSNMLQACAERSPKGVFVSGPTSSAVGLTAKVSTNGSIEAGALVLSDGGNCCIDELDKMSHSSHCILEAMEQQMISITKAGVCGNLRTRTSILAAANPIESSYDDSKTMNENLKKISRPLLTRFDLIHIVRENPSEQSDHMMLSYMNTYNKSKPVQSSPAGSSFFDSGCSLSSYKSKKRNVNNWLKLEPNENIEALPASLYQTYLGHVRQTCHPVLSDEAALELKNFYTQIRSLKHEGTTNMTPVTSRQLEALMRLTLSRARADMAAEATRNHAMEIIAIYKSTLIDIFDSSDGTDVCSQAMALKTVPLSSVATQSKPKQMKAFLQLLESRSDEQNKKEFQNSELKAIAMEIGIKDHNDIIYRLNNEGIILKTNGGYKLV
ncbi:unnamed protein product [Diamesa serratosioi]